jgi:phage-related minor tail protein
MNMKIDRTIRISGIIALTALIGTVTTSAISWGAQMDTRLAIVEVQARIVYDRLERIERKLDRAIENR